MKFMTYQYDGKIELGIMCGGDQKVLPIHKVIKNPPTDMITFIQNEADYLSDLEKASSESVESDAISLDEVELLAPIPRPTKNIFCVGKNYAEHAIEMGSKEDIPEHIMIFTKAPTTVIGPNQPVPSHHEVTNQLDYEGELAIVIGREGRNIKKEDAMSHVFGYTILNDVTARDMQKKHKQFFLGKSLDATCPIGPWIVHHTAVKDPGNLSVQTKVNGELRQDGNTEDLIFPIDVIIETISKGMTLEPGDLIATGTPEGVGKGFNPPKFLKSGDEVEITIEQIGALKNKIQ